MSAPAPAPTAAQPEAPEKKGRWGKGAKAPKAPKPKKVRKPWGIAPFLLIFALLTAGGAVAVIRYPIPGITAIQPPKGTETEAKQEPAPTTTPADPQREAELAQREAALAAREEAVQAKESQLGSAVNSLNNGESVTAALNRAARLYTGMAPYKAAPLMAELDDQTAVQILRLMTDDEAAAILSHMDTTRAARLFRELTRPPVPNPVGG